MADEVYCLDTSFFIESWVRRYSPDIFPPFWEYLEEAARAQQLVSPQDVREELEHPLDLKKWVKKQSEIFIDLEPRVVDSLKEVLEWARDRHLNQGRDFRPKDLKADPIVVALARVEDATIVTEESRSGDQGRPKIPDYCVNFGLRCIKTIDMIREMGWRFSK